MRIKHILVFLATVAFSIGVIFFIHIYAQERKKTVEK